MAHVWTHSAHPCTVTCSALPVTKGLGLRPFLHLQSQVGQDSGNFSFPPSLSLLTKLSRHKNLGWSQYLYSLPEAV